MGWFNKTCLWMNALYSSFLLGWAVSARLGGISVDELLFTVGNDGKTLTSTWLFYGVIGLALIIAFMNFGAAWYSNRGSSKPASQIQAVYNVRPTEQYTQQCQQPYQQPQQHFYGQCGQQQPQNPQNWQNVYK